MNTKELVMKRIETAYQLKKEAREQNNESMACYYEGQICGMKSVLRMLGITIEV